MERSKITVFGTVFFPRALIDGFEMRFSLKPKMHVLSPRAVVLCRFSLLRDLALFAESRTSAEFVRVSVRFVTMEVEAVEEQPQPPPPAAAGVAVEGRYDQMYAPVDLPDFPGQPFAIGYYGAFDPAKNKPVILSPKRLETYAKVHHPEWVQKGMSWTKLCEQLKVRHRTVEAAVAACPTLELNHVWG